MSSTRYRCVIFDLDGTLLDTRDAMIKAVNGLLRDRGRFPVEPSGLHDALHFGLGTMLRHALEPDDPARHGHAFRALEQELLERYLGRAPANVRLFPRMRQALDRMREAGIWMAICSNQAEACVRGLIATAGLGGHFQRLVGNDTLSARKPDRRPLAWLMCQAGDRPASTLMVGDSAVDALAAERAGCDCVIMAHGYGAGGAGGRYPSLPDAGALLRFMQVADGVTDSCG